MHNTSRFLRYIILIALLFTPLLLTGCGGGGGSVSQAVTPPDTKGGDTSGPFFTISSAVYSALTKAATFKATVSDSGSGIKSVLAKVTPPTGTVTNYTMTYSATTNEYSAVFSNVPENTTAVAKTYQVDITATDKSDNVTTQKKSFLVPGVTADTTVPAITQATAVYSAQTNAATLSVTATDSGSGIQSVQAIITPPTGATTTLDLVYDATTITYRVVYSNVPTNSTSSPKTYTVDFTVTDNSANHSSQQASFQVDGSTPPPPPIDFTVPNISLVVATYSAQTNSTALRAVATDAGSGMKSVQATVTLPGGGGTAIVDMTYNTTASEYRGTYSNVPANTTATAKTYFVDFTASDQSENTSTRQTSFIVPGNLDTTDPVFGTVTTQYNAQTKAATLSAAVTDAGSGVQAVTARVTLPAGGTADFNLVYDSLANVFSAVYSNVPANLTTEAQTYVVDFTASDKSGNTSTQQRSFQVAGLDAPPADSIAPTIADLAAVFDATAKTATFTATVTDAGSGVDSVQATVTLPTGATQLFDMIYDSTAGKYSAVYSNVPKNYSFSSKEYLVDILASDVTGNTSTQQTSFLVPGIDVPPPPGQL